MKRKSILKVTFKLSTPHKNPLRGCLANPSPKSVSDPYLVLEFIPGDPITFDGFADSVLKV